MKKFSVVFLCLGGVLLALRLLLGRLITAYGLEPGSLYLWLNLLCLACLTTGAALLIPWKRLRSQWRNEDDLIPLGQRLLKAFSELGRPAWITLCLLLTLVILPPVSLAVSSIWFRHWFSLSPDYNHMVMVRQARSSDQTTYGMDLGILLTPFSDDTFFMKGRLNFTWLTDDICLLSYLDLHREPMVKLAPKMVKSLPGPIFYSLTGTWSSADGSVALSMDRGLLTYHGAIVRTYSAGDSVQFGEDTLILCDTNEAPQLAIAVEKDSRSQKLQFQKGSHISVCLIPYTTDLVPSSNAVPVTLTKRSAD